MLLELQQDDLFEHVSTTPNVVVLYSASWCGNCRLVKPGFKKLAQNSELSFVLVDAEKFPLSRNLADVNSLPTIAYFTNGRLVQQIQSSKKIVIEAFINENTPDQPHT